MERCTFTPDECNRNISWSLLTSDKICSVLHRCPHPCYPLSLRNVSPEVRETAVASFLFAPWPRPSSKSLLVYSTKLMTLTSLRFQSKRASRDKAGLLFHSEVDCLMLWKLTREGDVGMDMAWVILARMECCSCHR